MKGSVSSGWVTFSLFNSYFLYVECLSKGGIRVKGEIH